MSFRYNYRRHNSYNTKSNKVRKVKTPGGKVTVLHVQKKTSRPVCGDTHFALPGVKNVHPTIRKHLKKRQKTVSRAYGGCKSHSSVRDKIVRAFLVEEQRCVKEVIQESGKKKKEEPKKAPATTKSAKKKSSK